jgi:hypothetical protein
MPINWSAEEADPIKQMLLNARSTANARPVQRERGLTSGRPAPDEAGLEKWARERGYALDFVPQYGTPQAPRPTHSDRGLASTPVIPQPRSKPLPSASRPVPGNISRSASKTKPATLILPTPKAVEQSGNDTCWAAALESWLGSVGDPARQRTQKQLLGSYSASDRSFDVAEFRQFVTALGMDTAHMKIEYFSQDTIKDMLRKHAVLFISYHSEPTSPWWHDVVLYGVTEDSLNERQYLVMNPSPHWADLKHKTLWPAGPQKWDKRHFFPVDTDLVIGWKTRGRAGQAY